MKKLTKRIVAIVAGVVVVGGVGLTVAYRIQQKQAQMQAMMASAAAAPEDTGIPVSVQTPEVGSLAVTTDYIGRIQPGEVVNVIPKMSGTVLDTYFEVGDRVRKGDLLFEFDASDLAPAQASLAALEASAAATAAGYELQKINVENGLGSQLDLKLLQTDTAYRQAKNAYDQAHKSLSDYVDAYEPNIDDLEDALDDIYDAERPLRDALKAAQSNLAQVQAKGGAQLKKAQTELDKAKDELSDYMNATIGVSYDSDVQYLHLKAAVTAWSNEVDLRGREIKEAQQKVSEIESQLSSNGTMRSQLKTQLNSAKDGYDTNLDQLKTAIRNASLGLDTSSETKDITEGKALDEANRVADATLASAKAQLEVSNLQAEQQRIQLEQQLSYTKIIAPIDGVIEQKAVEPHAMAGSSAPAYIISNKDIMVVKFSVSAAAAAQMAVGDTVRVENGSALYDGTIIEVGTMVDSQSGLFPVKARVDAPEGTLLTGVAVKVTASTQKADETLLIPVDSLYHEGDEDYVYVMSPEGVAVRTVVETGIMNDKTVQIVSGLTPESQVITSWNPNLLNGAKVTNAAAAQSANAASGGEASSAAPVSEPEASSSAGESAADGESPSDEEE